jgi:hypothetical protein
MLNDGLTTDTTSQLDVPWEDGDSLGVDSTQIGILEERHKISLGGFLQSGNGSGLEAQVSLVFLGDLTDKSLEWQLTDQQLCGLLVLSDFTQGNSTRATNK